MSVSNGQPASEQIFNGAFVSKTADSTMVSQLTMNNATSGTIITNVQQQINDNIDNIAQNTTDIATNRADIDSNDADILQNQLDIAPKYCRHRYQCYRTYKQGR